MKYNPFTPNSIVGPGMFAGRVDELHDLERALFQTKKGNPCHFLIHGERGIGKSSLLMVVKNLAIGKFDGLLSKSKYHFLAVDAEIEPSTTYDGLTRKIGAEMARRLRKVETLKNKAKDFWDFLTNWEILGVKYSKQNDYTDPTVLLEELCETVSDACERLSETLDGILIMIDEADNATSQTQLGEWVKVFTERLTKLGCNHVCLGISGISHVIDVMRQSHKSSPRILTHVLLEPLAHSERLEVINHGLRLVNEDAVFPITIQAEAADWIAKYSEGFPHFVQQYAYSAFETDNDNVIDINDVNYGVFKENGALDQLGVRYFEEMYRAQINSDEYRKVLHAMAESPDKYVARKDIKAATSLKETILGNALQALKNRHIILAHPEKQGLYRLPSDSFAVWIKAQVRREKERPHKKEF